MRYMKKIKNAEVNRSDTYSIKSNFRSFTVYCKAMGKEENKKLFNAMAIRF